LDGRTSGDCCSDWPKRVLPPTEMTGLTVFSAMLARPAQPVRVNELAVPDSHWVCWSECENRLSGTAPAVFADARYSALDMWRFRVPTLNTGASAPSRQAGASAASEGCRP
jgi:hypothetical protein